MSRGGDRSRSGSGPRDQPGPEVPDGPQPAAGGARPGFAVPALALAFVHLALLLFAVGGRLFHPYELEWMEGSCVDLVHRVLEGRPLYVRPTLGYVPYLYAPLYFYLSAGVASVVGLGFPALRLVSVAATAGLLLLSARWAARESGRSAAGWLAAGSFAACYEIGGTWLDLGRIDATWLFLLLACAYALRFGTGVRSALVAAALASLALLTKQTALAMVVAFAVGLAPSPRRLAVFALTTAALAGGATLWLDRVHDGWYWFFNFELPARHSIMTEPEALASFWTKDLLSRVPVFLALALGYVVALGRARRWREFLLVGCFAGGMGATSYLSRLHRGGYDNVLLPGYLVLALLAVLALAWLWSAAERKTLARVAAVALAAQLAWLLYDPRGLVPTAADRRAGDRLVERLAAIEGDVFVPSHGYLAIAAGKRPQAHLMALMDMRRSGADELADELEAELERALAERRFGALVLDTSFLVGTYSVKPNYRRTAKLFGDEDETFFPTTGLAMRPKYLWEPRRP